MKIRNGFVSNSSSSSFVISGFYIPKGIKFEEIVKKLFKNHPLFPVRKSPIRQRGCEHSELNVRFCPDCGKPMWIEIDYEENYQNELQVFTWEHMENEGIKYIKDKNFLGHIITRIYGDVDFYKSKTNLKDIMAKTEKLKEVIGINKDEEAVIVGITEAC